MHYWLFKSEPLTFSLDHLVQSPKQTTFWNGVRNFQVRNFLRDEIAVGDKGFFYHSNCKVPGIAGSITVVKAGYPDESAFDKNSPYFDPKSTDEKPLWYGVDVQFEQRFIHFVTLAELKRESTLKEMMILRRGNRLSITPITESEWQVIQRLGCLSG